MTRKFDYEYQDTPDSKYQYDVDFFVRHKMMLRFRKYFRGNHALEVGAFLGDMTELISKSFSRTEVIEASKELSETVKERFKNHVTVHNTQLEDFEGKSNFENIFLIHTLEHFDDSAECLLKIKDLLTETGHCFIAVPNARALSRQIAVEMGVVPFNTAVTDSEKAHGHRCTYTLDILCHQIRNVGLEIVERGGVLVKPLANFQIDSALNSGLISLDFLEACDSLASVYPDLSSSIYVIARRS